MKKIYLVIFLLSHTAISLAQTPVWSSWTTVSCFKGFQTAVLNNGYVKTINQYSWQAKIKSTYNKKVTFNMIWRVGGEVVRIGLVTLNPGQEYSHTSRYFNSNSNNLAVEIDKVNFSDQLNCYASCDNGSPNQPNCDGKSNVSNTPNSTNNLDEYNKSKQRIENEMQQKNTEIIKQNQTNANKQQQFLTYYNAGIKAFNAGNWSEASTQFQQAIPYATTEEQLKNAQTNYAKSKQNAERINNNAKLSTAATQVASAIDDLIAEGRRKREEKAEIKRFEEQKKKEFILENKDYYLEITSMENDQLGEYADYLVLKIEKLGYQYISMYGPSGSSDKSTWASKGCILILNKGTDTITINPRFNFGLSNGLMRQYWIYSKTLSAETLTGLANKIFNNEVKELKDQSIANQGRIYFLSDLAPQVVRENTSASDLINSKYKGYKIEFAKSNQLATENTIKAYVHNAVIFHNGQGDLKRDKEQAIYWYTKAAEMGDPNSMVSLGYKLLPEAGDKDFSKALYWFKKASDLEYPAAYEAFADMYKYGRGMPVSYEEAKNWYMKAIDKGSASAMNNLGLMYKYGGANFKKNKSEANKWYKLACEKNPVYCKK